MAGEMSKMWAVFMFAFQALIVYPITSQDIVLNTPQVLLPYVAKKSTPTTYLLRAPKGCFKWSSTKPNVATITPIDEKSNRSISAADSEENQCSSAALITVTQKSPDEDTTVVLAEEEGTGFILRCDVFVDSIHHIEIATTTRELLLGESPEVFEVFAYDAEGNIFTVLGSQTFEWTSAPVLHKGSTQDPRTILRFLWFRDSQYETTTEIYSLEEQRIRGSSILVEGINTGEAIITAKLTNPEYKVVKPSKVKVVVVDNIMLLPPLSYIMQHQQVSYKACQLRRGKRKDISLPSNQYTIGVVNATVIQLQSHDASVYGLQLGVSKVQLLDKNMAEASTMKRPSATVHVVEPGKLGFAINPGKYWVLQTQKRYEMHVQLYDDENNRILITDNTMFDSTLLKEYFDIHQKSDNGSYFFVTAKKIGKTVLSASLKEISNPPQESYGLKQLYGEQNIEIYDPLRLEPEIVVFPWDPTFNSLQGYRYEFNATGGSGNFLWTSGNSSLCSVNKKGTVVAGSNIGETKIKVSDAKNPTFFERSIVKVLPPEELSFLSHHLEVEVGKTLTLPISVLAFLDKDKKEKTIFQDCRKMEILVSFHDLTILTNVKQGVDFVLPVEGCTTITLKGIKVGSTMVTAVYKYGNIVLQDSIYIATYNPVQVIDPLKFATVALGSTKRIVAEGGPLPWILDPSHHYELMSAEEEDWVKINQARKVKDVGEHNNLHYFDVTCTVLGEQLLTVEIGNKGSISLQHPAVSSAKTKFSCVPPATIVLLPAIILPLIDGTRKTYESCKDEFKRIPVRNDRELKVHLLVFDKNGNEFDDASSLNVDWSTDHLPIGHFDTKQTQYEERQVDKKNRKNGGKKMFNLLQISQKSNTLVVTAQITSLNDGTSQIAIVPDISTHLHLIPLPVAQITPDDLNLYAHPSNVVDLDVTHGTGHFVLKANDDTLSKIQYIAPSNKITLTPQRRGTLSLRLFDACLDADEPTVVDVGLHDADGIVLTVKDKVEVGHSINAKCIATSFDHRELKVDASSQLKLSLRMASKIVDIKSLTSSNSIESGEKIYNVTGKTVGVTSLYCHATKLSGMELTSIHKEVQVFSAIKLEPKYILLIVGSVFQIHSQGGPRPHSTIFNINNETVAGVSTAGLITAKIVGTTRVIGKAKGIESGNQIVYSSDEIIVEVIRMKGFKIDLKSRNIISNAKVGILAVGVNDEGPFTFATSPPYLQFHWSSSNHKTALVESVHAEAGVSVSTDKDFRAVLRTSTPGQVTIKMKVVVMSNDFIQVTDHVQLEDEVQVQVYEKLELIKPASGKLLLPPNVYTRIKTNRDHMSQVTYELLSSCSKDGSNHVISVSPSGQIRSHSATGTANILVTVHEDFGFNQTALIEVEVKPIASITLVSMSKFVVFNTNRPSFPIGSNAVFGVTLHDNMGRKFDVASIGVQHRVSRDDIIDILPNSENATFTLRGTSIGETILKVWDKDNVAISDYVRIRVTEGVSPTRISVPLGALICFQTAVTTETGWWSASGNPLSINRKSGVSAAVAVGSTMVYYNEAGFTTHTEVSVTTPTVQPSIIEDEDYLLLTNSQPTKNFYIALDSNESLDEQKCMQTLNSNDVIIPFSCQANFLDNDDALTVADVFNIQSGYVEGRPACSFTTRDMSSERLKSISLTDRTVALTVILTDKNSHVEYKSYKTTNVRFTPYMYVTSSSLTLSKSQTSDSLDVHGSYSQLNSLKISTDSSLLSVTKVKTEENTRQRYQVSISEVPTSDVNASIKLYSQITKSVQLVLVRIRGEVVYDTTQCLPKPSTTSSFSFKRLVSSVIGDSGALVVAYTIMIATIILILILYHFYVKSKQNTPVVIHSPYIHSTQAYSPHTHSPPPYQYSPSYQSPPNTTPGSYGPNKHTPTRLFSVSQ